MCSIKKGSILRANSKDAVCSFSRNTLDEELQQNAPTLHNLLEGSLQVNVVLSQERRRKKQESNYWCLCFSSMPVKQFFIALYGTTCAFLCACSYQNQLMNLPQRIVSLILYRGGANKRVSTCNI